MTMTALRVGSIGLGWWGGTLAEKGRLAGLELVSCFARSEASREEFAAEHGCRPAESLDEMLSDPDLDAVLIATPHSTHAGPEALEATVILEGIVESASRGMVVDLDEVRDRG
jgi:predicted dehydrogenase